MLKEDVKKLSGDPDGLLTYEYIANHIDDCEEDIEALTENLIRVDLSGQFTASAARYLHAIDSGKYAEAIKTLVSKTIDKDREHKYLPGLMAGIYGKDYAERVSELIEADDNFRRIYKRLFPTGI